MRLYFYIMQLCYRYKKLRLSVRQTILTLFGLVVAIFVHIQLASVSTSIDGTSKTLSFSEDYSFRDYNRSMAGDYLVARFTHRQADFSTSSYYFERSSQLNPENKELINRNFYSKILAGYVEDALQYSKDHPHLQRELFLGQVLMALNDMHQRQYVSAEEHLLRIAHSDISGITDTDMMMVSLLVVWNKVAQGQLWEAYDLLSVLSEADKNRSAMWQYHLALIADLGDFKTQARVAYGKTLQNSDMMPYHIVAAAGNFYSRSGALQKARDVYALYREHYSVSHYFIDELADVEAGNVPDVRIVKDAQAGFSHVLLDIIRIAYGNDDIEEALLLSRILLHFNPDMPEALFMLGLLSEEMGNVEQAIMFFERIGEQSHLYQQARINMAKNLHQSGYEDDAKDMLLFLSQDYSQNHELMTALANIMHKEKNYRAAITLYTQMLDEVEEIESRHWPILFNRAINYEQIGHWDKAEQDLVFCIELNPEQPDVLNFLAYHWVEQGRHIDTATDMLEIAVAMRPNDPHILDSMGWALFKQGKHIEASGFLEKAVELKPNDPVLFDHLGDVYYHLGRATEAVYQWSHALNFELDAQQRITIRQKIDNGIKIKQASKGSEIIGFNTP